VKVAEDVIVRKCAEEVTGVTLEAMLGEWVSYARRLCRWIIGE
jgi:hypothetical protein